MNREGKILDTYEFFEDTDNTHAVDYAYFIIRIDDVEQYGKDLLNLSVPVYFTVGGYYK